MATRRQRKKKNDSITPPKANEEDEMTEAIFKMGMDTAGSLDIGNLNLPFNNTENANQPKQGTEGSQRSQQDISELLKRLGPHAGQSSEGEDGNSSGVPGLEEMFGTGGMGGGFQGLGQMQGGRGGGFQGMGNMQGGMGGGFQGMGQMQGGMQQGVNADQEQIAISQDELVTLFNQVEHMEDKDKEAALLAMGGPELLQHYYQFTKRGGEGNSQLQDRVPGSGGMLGAGGDSRRRGRSRGTSRFGNQLMGGRNGSEGGIPGMGRGGMPSLGGMGGAGNELSQENVMQMLQLFQTLESLPNKEKEEHLLSMGGPQFVQTYNEKIRPMMQQMGLGQNSGSASESVGGQGGGIPGLSGMFGGQGGGAPNLANMFEGQGGGVPGLGGQSGGVPGLGGMFGGQGGGGGAPNLANMFGGQGGGLPGLGGQSGGGPGLGGMFGGQGGGGGAPNLANMFGGQGGGLPGLGGQSGGGPGLGGMFGGQGGGGPGGNSGGVPGLGGQDGGVPGLGGMFGGQGGGVPGLGGMFGGQGGGSAGLGGMFGRQGSGASGLGSMFGGQGGRRQANQGSAQIDPETREGLDQLNDADRQAALQAMETLDPSQSGGQSFMPEPPSQRPRHYEIPDQPYEPKGPGMYQFHRKQPLQLPIHGGGIESRPDMDCMMPSVRKKKRFGDRPLVRTHGSSIDLEGYFKHLVKIWTEAATECEDPMCDGPSTILLLDISESMRGQAFQEAMDAINLFIEGLEENRRIYNFDENLALIIFFGDTFEVTHLTNDYEKIKGALAEIKDVEGSSPLTMPLAVVQGIATRAKPVKVKGHDVFTRVVIFTDGIVTPPGFDPAVEEYVRKRVQKSVDDNFYELTQDLIHDNHVRMFTVPCGDKGREKREWFCNRIAHDGFGEKVYPEDAKWLSRNYICEQIIAECKVKLPPLDPENPEAKPDEEYITELAKSMYDDVDEDDVEFIVKRFTERMQRPPLSKRQRREKRLQDQMDRAEAIARGENPPPLPEDPRKKKKEGRKSLEELLGIDSSDDDEEEDDDEETDLLFRLPGLLGDEEDAENDPLTKQKIEELLDYYGGGPSKIDNLPIMPQIGVRVKQGPDWMWQKNDIPEDDIGIVTGIDQEDPGWIKVRWNKCGKEEDYRFGVDYEFDVEPVDGGMGVVLWPEGKERKIVEPIWLQELNREKKELEELRAKIEKEKEKERKAKETEEQAKKKEEAKEGIETTYEQEEKDKDETAQSSLSQTDEKGWSDLAPSSASSDTEAPVCYVWQYQDDDGTWRTHETDIQAKLETTYLKRNGKGTVVIDFKGHNERVVFEKMEQRQIEKSRKRPVRRIEADLERLKELQDMFSR